WKRSFEQAAPPIGTMKFAFDNKLEGEEEHGGRHCAKIAVTSKVALESDDSTESPMDIKMDASEGEGTQWFDTKTGRLVELALSMDLKMVMSRKSEKGADADEAKMEMTTSISTKMLLLGKDAPAFERAAAKPAGAKERWS